MGPVGAFQVSMASNSVVGEQEMITLYRIDMSLTPQTSEPTGVLAMSDDYAPSFMSLYDLPETGSGEE